MLCLFTLVVMIVAVLNDVLLLLFGALKYIAAVAFGVAAPDISLT